jgi:hypothetical protein
MLLFRTRTLALQSTRKTFASVLNGMCFSESREASSEWDSGYSRNDNPKPTQPVPEVVAPVLADASDTAKDEERGILD